MGELVDFIAFFRMRERPTGTSFRGGEVVPFMGIRYARLEPLASEFDRSQRAVAGARKRRKGKNNPS